jgi:hypothetical protein
MILFKRCVWTATGLFFSCALVYSVLASENYDPMSWLGRALLATSAAIGLYSGLFASDELVSRSIPPFQ